MSWDDFQRAAKDADEAASVAHDFIYGKNNVSKRAASEAIWCIHNALRPFIPLSVPPVLLDVPANKEPCCSPDLPHVGTTTGLSDGTHYWAADVPANKDTDE